VGILLALVQDGFFSGTEGGDENEDASSVKNKGNKKQLTERTRTNEIIDGCEKTTLVHIKAT
jgi:hypothetical protein